jgi:hypothetical protein
MNKYKNVLPLDKIRMIAEDKAYKRLLKYKNMNIDFDYMIEQYESERLAFPYNIVSINWLYLANRLLDNIK